MKKISLASSIFALCLAFSGCTETAPNKIVVTANTNAAVTNSNMNAAAANSNAGANINTKTFSNTSKNISTTDAEFINTVALGGMAEVQLGGVAVIKAKNDELKAFAQKMITDHSAVHRELKSLAKQKGFELPPGVTPEQQQVTDKLTKMSGAAFDREYARMMVGDHEKDVAEFQKQADNATDADTKRFAAETLPTLKMHLQMIRDIQGKLK